MQKLVLVMCLGVLGCSTTSRAWAPEVRKQVLDSCVAEMLSIGAPLEVGKHFCDCIVAKVEENVPEPTGESISKYLSSPEGDKEMNKCVEATKKKFNLK